ncbi:hypothetical protein P9847_23630 [Paenibacillus chibensis]|uniref:Uncharacterized protein n=1 Tax=Paenibacillus chibensis TaxID=59846 RepID=A0ABU6PZF5_9BACL|nr:hypothetical protein [Paenibacillus chibensis]
MPRKLWLALLSGLLCAALAGCSGSSSSKGSSSPVMKDMYNSGQSVSGDVYSKGQISPP